MWKLWQMRILMDKDVFVTIISPDFKVRQWKTRHIVPPVQADLAVDGVIIMNVLNKKHNCNEKIFI
jgi:hypothetical protein